MIENSKGKTVNPAVVEHMAMENEKLRGLLREFCERVERGEVRSKSTYAKFRDALSQQAEPVCVHEFVPFRSDCTKCGHPYAEPCDLGEGGISSSWKRAVIEAQAAVEQAPAQDEREFNTSDSDLTELLNIAADMLKGVGGGMDLGIYFAAVLERVEQRLADRPAQTEQQPVAFLYYDDSDVDAYLKLKPFVLVVGNEGPEQHLARRKPGTQGVKPLYAAPIAQTAPLESEHHVQLLGQALGECIAAAGIIRPDASLSGPELLMFADDLKRHLAEQTAPQPEQSGLVEALAAAAQSLEAISNRAGKDEFMQDMADVRSYARSRAGVARAALSAQGASK